jgi:SAM-dependent methyltransferase
MKAELSRLSAELEDRHWWFVGRRRIMRALVRRVVEPSRSRLVVDVGCGTGGNVAALASEYECVGIDPSSAAIELAAARFAAVRFVCGHAPEGLGEAAQRANMVLLMDVLEHVSDDFHLLSSVVAELAPGAHVLLTVPADPELWSGHDEVHGHYRRYEVPRLEALWAGLPVSVRLLSHFNSRLYPAVRAVRAVSRWRGRSSGRAGTDLWLPALPVNTVLTELLAGEARVLEAVLAGRRARGYGSGVSLIAVLRREEGACAPRWKPADAGPDIHVPG